KIVVKQFSVFCPKVLAGIGGDLLPETITSRCVPIRMQRKGPGDQVERFRKRQAQLRSQPLREALADWAESALDHLAGAEPELPAALSARQQDVWEPLLAIADLAGDDWPKQARHAAVVLHEREGRLEKSEELLHAVRDAFDALRVDRLHTHTLIE